MIHPRSDSPFTSPFAAILARTRNSLLLQPPYVHPGQRVPLRRVRSSHSPGPDLTIMLRNLTSSPPPASSLSLEHGRLPPASGHCISCGLCLEFSSLYYLRDSSPHLPQVSLLMSLPRVPLTELSLVACPPPLPATTLSVRLCRADSSEGGGFVLLAVVPPAAGA